MSEQEERELDQRVQQFLDGDLPGREGTRLLLEAESDARLSNELSGYRRLYSLLDTMPRSEPSADFDRRIFESIPRERYASAPRRVWPTLVLRVSRWAWLRALWRRLHTGAVETKDGGNAAKGNH